ncbi:MAG: phage tail tape measure protein [Romboutsia timonensis]
MTSQVQSMAVEMGSSATEVMNVVKTYANAKDTMDSVLAKSKTAIALSNISGLDTTSTTKALNTVSNAFKMMAEDGSNAAEATEHIGDVLTSVSKNMQYDFGSGIQELVGAIQESGNVAQQAGISLERYSAMVGAVIEATGRSGSEISNGIKMIAARVLQVKELGDELGVTSAEMGKAGVALSKFNIEVMNSDGSMRNLDDILKDLASRWGTMTDAERQYVAEQVAGNRQRATLISLMETMGTQELLYQEAMSGSGAMMEAQAVYADSLAGKLGTLKASLQSLASTTLNSDMFKGLITGFTTVVQWVDKFISKFGMLNTVMGLVVPTFATFNKTLSPIANSFTQMIPGIGNYAKSLQDVISKSKKTITANTDMINSIRKSGDTSVEASGRIAKYSAEIDSAKSSMMTAQVKALALNMAIGVGISVAISLAVSAFKKMADEASLTSKEIDEFADKVNNLKNVDIETKNTSRLLDSYKAAVKELSTLQKGTEEFANKQATVNKLRAELQSIDGFSGIIGNENLKLEEQLALAKAINEARRKEAIEELKSAAPSKDEIKSLYREVDQYKARIKYHNEEIAKIREKEYAYTKYGERVKISEEEQAKAIKVHTDAIEGMNKEQITTAEKIAQIISLNEDLNALGAEPIPLKDEYASWAKETLRLAEEQKNLDEVINSTTNSMGKSVTTYSGFGAAISSLGAEVSRSEEELKGFEDTLNNLMSNPDLNVDMNIDLSSASSEFEALSGVVKDLGDQLERTLGILGQYYSRGDLLQKMLDDLNENGYISEETRRSIFNSGDEQLISMLSEEYDLWGNINDEIDKNNQKITENEQRAIKQSQDKIKANEAWLKSLEEEQKRQEELNNLKEKTANIKYDRQYGVWDFTNGAGEQVKVLSKIREEADGTKTAIIELNEQPVAVKFDSNGFVAEQVALVSGLDGIYAQIEELNGEKIFVQFDSETGEVIKTQLGDLKEQANGFSNAIAEIDGKKYVVTLDANGAMVAFNEVTDGADGLEGKLKEIDGKIYKVNFDSETLEEKLIEVNKNLDGTYSYLDESGDHPVEIILNGDGEVIGKIDGVNTKIDEFEKRKEALNGTSLKVTVEGTEQTVTNLNNITENADGTYTAIGELNGKHVLITFDNKGQAVEYLGEITENTDGTRSAIVELNGKHVLITFDNKGQTITDLGEITENTDGTRSAIVELNGKHVLITFDNKGNIIGDLEEVTDGADTASTARDNLNKTPFKPTVTGADKAAKDLYDVAHAAEVARGQAGEIRITTIHENITRNITQTANTVYHGGAATGALPKSIDIPSEQIFEPVEATQDVVIMANPIVDTSEVEAFDMGSEVSESSGGDGLSAPIAEVQPMALGGTSVGSISYSQIGESSSDNKGKLEYELNLYYELNDVLEDYNNLLAENKLLQEKATSEEKIKLQQEELTLMTEQLDVIKQLNNQYQAEADNLKNVFQTNGFNIDAYGNITNLNEKMQELLNNAEALSGEDKDNQVKVIKNLIDMVERYTELTNNLIPGATQDWISLNNAIKETASSSDDRSKLEYELDLYYELNDTLEDYSNLLAENKLLQDSAIYEEKIKLQQEELALMTKKLDVIKQLNNQYQAEADNLKNVLLDNGFNIDTYGNITNLNEKMQELISNAEKLSDTDRESDVQVIEDLMDITERYTELTNNLIPGATQDWISLNNAIKETASSSLEGIRSKILEALRNKYESEKQTKLDILDGRIAKLKAELASLEKEDTDKRAKLLKLQQEKTKWEMDDSIYGKKKVAELNKQIAELELQIHKDAINQEIENIEAQKDRVGEDYDELLDDRKLYEEANKLLVENKQEEILALLNNYYESYSDIGK